MTKTLNLEILDRLVNDVPCFSGGKKEHFSYEVREGILQRDKCICQLCNEPGNIVHHINPRGDGSFENGITLCNVCHESAHLLLYKYRGYRAYNPEMAQFERNVNGLLSAIVGRMECTNQLSEQVKSLDDFMHKQYGSMDRREKMYDWLLRDYVRFLSEIEKDLLKIPVSVRKKYGVRIKNNDLRRSEILRERLR